tara:strand:- start:3474 stop:4046 length:573 start_codon:yes stop_codon:yes gene_type:complete
MVKLKDIIEDLELGKVYTDKDRPPFQVKEALTKNAYPELKGQNKYLLSSVKNLMRAIKNQNDLTTREEIEYIHTKSKLMMSMLDDKRYNESINEDFWALPANWSSQEAKLHLDMDIKKMSKHLGKASQQVIKIMMDGVKGGRYDALDIIRGIETGPWNRTHEGERPFMKMLWNKVRDGFRRYVPDRKLRK